MSIIFLLILLHSLTRGTLNKVSMFAIVYNWLMYQSYIEVQSCQTDDILLNLRICLSMGILSFAMIYVCSTSCFVNCSWLRRKGGVLTELPVSSKTFFKTKPFSAMMVSCLMYVHVYFLDAARWNNLLVVLFKIQAGPM